MFPLRDDNPVSITPYVTIAIIVICALVFIGQLGLNGEAAQVHIYRYGLIPAVLMGKETPPPDIAVLPAWMTVFSSMFMHGGFMHIAGNMLFLWIFGNNIEEALGHVRFVFFYLVCGLAAAAAQILQTPESVIPMVGASGAVSGVMGAYLLLYPRAQILTLVFFGFFVTTLRISAFWYLGIWIGLQGLSALIQDNSQAGGVAFWAHIGGFIAGLALIVLMGGKGIGRPGGGKRPAASAALLSRRRQRRRRGPWG